MGSAEVLAETIAITVQLLLLPVMPLQDLFFSSLPILAPSPGYLLLYPLEKKQTGLVRTGQCKAERPAWTQHLNIW